jgi:antitoxin component YwqK of YwqJK toxin-antitoxin module
MQYSKKIAICTGLFLASCSFNQDTLEDQKPANFYSVDTVLENTVHLNPNLGLVFYKDEPFTGVVITPYPNNQIEKSIHYLRGKKNGAYSKWYLDGQISYAANYFDGKKTGLSQTWWKNGQLRSQNNFDIGKAHGTQKQWYKSGALFKQLNYTHGKEEGMQKAWRENGKIYNNYEAKNGRFFGLKRATLCYELEDEIVQK